MKLLYAFIIFGYVCNDSPVMEEQCNQVYFPGVLSRADCSVKFASYMSRYQDKIAKNSLSMTDVEVYCIPSDPDSVDKPTKLSYSIL